MRLLPRDEKFFELFGELSGYLTVGAQLLLGIFENPHDLGIRGRKGAGRRAQGVSDHPRHYHQAESELRHTILTARTFTRLASSLDDVLDFTNAGRRRSIPAGSMPCWSIQSSPT